MTDRKHTGLTASFRRVRLIARHTLGEALRLRLTLLLALIGGALVIGALGLREFNFGSAELKFIGDFGLGALGGGHPACGAGDHTIIFLAKSRDGQRTAC